MIKNGVLMVKLVKIQNYLYLILVFRILIISLGQAMKLAQVLLEMIKLIKIIIIIRLLFYYFLNFIYLELWYIF